MQIDSGELASLALAYAVDLAPKIGGAVLFLLGAWVLAGWTRRVVRRALERTRFDQTLTLFFSSMARWAVLLMAIVSCLAIFGIQTTSFAAVLGAAGLAIGLAFQGALSNIASGVMLLVFRPFEVGDVVSAGGITGKVAEIQLFTTVFDTPDNRRIIMPNSLIFGATIENVTHHHTRRVDVAVGCDYGADIDRTRAVLEAAVAKVDGVLEEPGPQVLLSELGASSVDWIVRVWTSTDEYWAVKEALTRSVKYELEGAGIGIPFPQMDVHVDGSLVR